MVPRGTIEGPPGRGAPPMARNRRRMLARGPTAETGPERALNAMPPAAQKGLTSWQDPGVVVGAILFA